jgi:hypothetical protein
MKVRCTRGFGKVTDPETGEEINVEDTFEVSEAVFERLDDAYPGMEVVNGGSETGDESADTSDTTEEQSAEAETFRCGINDCSREVDNPEATCWQHSK